MVQIGGLSMEQYLPDIYCQSIYSVNYEKLEQCGIKCLLFDLDNTIVPYSIKEPPEKAIQFFQQLKQKFRVILFSNSPKHRLKPFKDGIEVDCLASAKKPNKKNFLKILEEYKLEENEVAIIGDQILTDIIGGNKIGITTILVNPISTKDPFWTKPNRFFEKRIMHKLTDRGLFFKGRYYE